LLSVHAAELRNEEDESNPGDDQQRGQDRRGAVRCSPLITAAGAR